MTVYTRSINFELYEKMKEFIPADVTLARWTGYNDYRDALRFIQDVIADCPDFAVILDEDCFIHDFSKITGIINHMIEKEFTHAGIPDRGAVAHRTIRWTTLNPFFNILDCKALRFLGALDKIDKPGYIDAVAPEFEIFDDFYMHLYKVGTPLFLKGATRSDGITTHVMDHEGNFFALHSWYSREFNNPGPHRDRILKVYQDAKDLLI